MKNPKTPEQLQAAISKLEKANAKWPCPDRTKLITQYKNRLALMPA